MYGNVGCFRARCSTNCCDVWLSLSKHDNVRNTNGHEGYFVFFIILFFSHLNGQGSFRICYAALLCFSSFVSFRFLHLWGFRRSSFTTERAFNKSWAIFSFFFSYFSFFISRVRVFSKPWCLFGQLFTQLVNVCIVVVGLFFFVFFYLFYLFINNSFCQVFWNLF